VCAVGSNQTIRRLLQSTASQDEWRPNRHWPGEPVLNKLTQPQPGATPTETHMTRIPRSRDGDSNARDINEVLHSMDGALIDGGCLYCDAYQEIISPFRGSPRVTLLRIHHDDDCPWWLGRQIMQGLQS
jgi:hypothetical protein